MVHPLWPRGASLDASIAQGLAALPPDEASHLVQEALQHTEGDTERASCVLSAALRGLAAENAEGAVDKNPTDTGMSRSSSTSSIGRGLAGGASRVTIYSDHGSGSEDDDDDVLPGLNSGSSTIVQYPARRSNRCQSQSQVPPGTCAPADAGASWMESVREEKPESERTLRVHYQPSNSVFQDSDDEEDTRLDMEQFAAWGHRVETQLETEQFAALGEKIDSMTKTFPVRPREGSLESSPQVPLAAQESQVFVVMGCGDAVCYKLPTKKLDQGEAPKPKTAPDRDSSEQVDARCWKYLESRYPIIPQARRIRNKHLQLADERLAHIQKEEELLAMRKRSIAFQARCKRDQRIDSKHAGRLHLVLSAEFEVASKALASKLDCSSAINLEQLHSFIRMELRVSQEAISDTDIDTLAAVLSPCNGSFHFDAEDLLRFLRDGVDALPAWRVIFADEKRATELISKRFWPFLQKESMRHRATLA